MQFTKEYVRELGESMGLTIESIIPFSGAMSVTDSGIFDDKTSTNFIYFGLIDFAVRFATTSGQITVNVIRKKSSSSSYTVVFANIIMSTAGSNNGQMRGFFQSITPVTMNSGCWLTFVGYKIKLTKSPTS